MGDTADVIFVSVRQHERGDARLLLQVREVRNDAIHAEQFGIGKHHARVDDNGRVIGIIDESDVLVKVHRDASHFNYQVKQAMTDQLETLPSSAKIDDLFGVFDRGRVAIVMDGDQFLGLITRSDLLSYLRRHMPKSPVEREFS